MIMEITAATPRKASVIDGMSATPSGNPKVKKRQGAGSLVAATATPGASVAGGPAGHSTGWES